MMQEEQDGVEPFKDVPLENNDVEGAKAIIEEVYGRYTAAIGEKQKLNKNLFSMWTNRNVSKTSSGDYGKKSAEAFLQNLVGDDVKSILVHLLEHGSWGGCSRQLVFLCFDLIVGHVNGGQIPAEFFNNPAKPFAGIQGLQVADTENDFVKSKSRSTFRLSALTEKFNALKSELPLNKTAYDNFVKGVNEREDNLYRIILQARSRRV